MAYILMAPMYKTMTSGKIDKYLVKEGDKVKQGMAVAEIVAEGYFTLLSESDGIIKGAERNISGRKRNARAHEPAREI